MCSGGVSPRSWPPRAEVCRGPGDGGPSRPAGRVVSHTSSAPPLRPRRSRQPGLRLSMICFPRGWQLTALSFCITRNAGQAPTAPFVENQCGACPVCGFFGTHPSLARGPGQMGPAPLTRTPRAPGAVPGSPGDRWTDHDQEGLSPSLWPVCDPGKLGWQPGKWELTAGFLHGPIRQYKRASCKRIFNSSLQAQVMKRLQTGNVRRSIKCLPGGGVAEVCRTVTRLSDGASYGCEPL